MKKLPVTLATLVALFTPALAFAQDQAAEGNEGGGGLSLDSIISSLNEHVAPWGIKIVGAIFALFAAWIVAGMCGRAVRRVAKARDIDATVTGFLATVARYAVLTASIVGILGVFGIETSSFAAIIGAAGLAIGLAFEGTLGNLAAGVMLLVFRPFKVGDVITAGGVTGKVDVLELFTTTMTTPDNRKIIVPNKVIAGDTITNFAGYDERRCDVDVGVDYDADCDVVREALTEALAMIETKLDDKDHQIFLKALGGSSVDWQVRVWTKTADFWVTHEQTVRAIHKKLGEKGIGIPYPTMDVNLDAAVVEALGKK